MKRAGNVFTHAFWHPIKGKTVNLSLETGDEGIARRLVEDIRLLCRQKEILKDPDGHVPELQAYERRAVECVLGKDDAAALLGDKATGLANRIEQARAKASEAAFDEAMGRRMAKVKGRRINKALLEEIREDATQEASANERAAFIKQLRKEPLDNKDKIIFEQAERIKTLQRSLDLADGQLKQANMERNEHVKVTMRTASAAFMDTYKRSQHQVSHMRSTLAEFAAMLPDGEATRLGEIRDVMIDEYLSKLPVAAPTKRRKKSALSMYLRWSAKQYRLNRNPMLTTDNIHGAQRASKGITAFREHEDIAGFLDALKPAPYWRAWCATAILLGPRWGEQARMELAHVHAADWYVVIFATKTGQERRVPIERTVLADILTDHVASRERERRGKRATTPQRSPLLFPTLADVANAPASKRTDAAGWCSNRNFLNHYYAALKEMLPSRKRGDHWGNSAFWDAWAEHGSTKAQPKGALSPWGNDEFRHSYGTALGMCGFNSLEISRLMGNSPEVCDRHYVAAASIGRRNRWPFEF